MMKKMNVLIRNGIDIVEEARRSVDRQNEVNTAIKIELSRFSNDVNREFNELYNRISKIKKDYKQRIEFLENMCKHYTDNLSQQLKAFTFNGMEIRQKLSKLEWDLIFLQCVGRAFIEASTSYLSKIHFDNIEQTFIEVLRLVYKSVQNLQRLPYTLEGTVNGENVDQNNLMDEANKLLAMCVNIQQKIMNTKSTSTLERSSAGSDTETVSSEEDRIMNTSDLKSKEKQ
ncbi:FMN-dependent NADH:quinone oxidoreductase [Dirofilaria immitis]